MIDGIGQRYHQRPSEILGLENRIVAFDFDIAIAMKASKLEKDGTMDSKAVEERQTTGFKAAKSLQDKVIRSRSKR